MLEYRVISIGALSHHPLWEERAAVRTAHATTTLVRTDDRTILVDPGLPAEALVARLNERAGLTPQQITDVFLTNFRPSHRRGLAAFDQAKWWITERERETVGVHLVGEFEKAEDDQLRQMLQQEIALMQRCQAAPDQLAKQVDLFPLPGFTPGTCGLLLSLPSATVLVAGDGMPTAEHLNQGKVLPGGFDIEQARASFAEAVEIADWIIAGHDNLLPNMTRRMF
jgi:glyoxylase-like metal-dependent hydrolase (beta-lactamase superfamily II)